jgi:outer membrane protein assembly factor BamB
MNSNWIRTSILGLALAGTLSFTASAAKADWPQWRGPLRDGHSPDKGLLSEWPAGGPPLVWTVKDLGGGYSTPSVVGGRIYGMGYSETDEVVWALDAKDGKEIWRTVLGPADRKIGYS